MTTPNPPALKHSHLTPAPAQNMLKTTIASISSIFLQCKVSEHPLRSAATRSAPCGSFLSTVARPTRPMSPPPRCAAVWAWYVWGVPFHTHRLTVLTTGMMPYWCPIDLVALPTVDEVYQLSFLTWGSPLSCKCFYTLYCSPLYPTQFHCSLPPLPLPVCQVTKPMQLQGLSLRDRVLDSVVLAMGRAEFQTQSLSFRGCLNVPKKMVKGGYWDSLC